MLTKLYNTVFEAESSSFDINKNYYSVILNFTDPSFGGGQLSSNMNRYLPKNSYEEASFTISPRTQTELMSFLEIRHANAREYSINTCFALIFDYTDTDLCGQVAESVKLLHEANFVSNGDKVVVLAAFPDNDAVAISYIKAIENTYFPDNTEFYFFIKGKYTTSQLVDDISGTLLLISDKSICAQVERNTAATIQAVDTTVQSFPEEGREKIGQQKKIVWSTVNVSYNDDKMDFLRYYMHKLYDNVAQFSKVNMKQVCETFNNTRLTNTNSHDIKSALHAKLLHAIKVIPKVSTANMDEPNALMNYFNFVYANQGLDGEKVVELTMKVNLKNHNIFNQQMIVEAANTVFNTAIQYHSHNIKEEIFAALENYLKTMADEAEKSRRIIMSDLQITNDIRTAISKYISDYIEYDDKLKKQEFWREVLTYIRRNDDIYGDLNEQCRALSEEFAKNKAKLNYYAEMGFSDNFSSYPAKLLLYPHENKQFCSIIRNAYYNHLNDVAEVAPVIPKNDRVFDIFFNVNSNFIRDYQYNFSVGTTFSVIINQRIGQYFMFVNNPRQDLQHFNFHI